MEITRSVLQAFRADLDKELVAIGKRHGLLVQSGNGSFTDSTASMKLIIAVETGKRGESAKYAKAEEDWNRYYAQYGFNKGWLGKTFPYAGTTWKLLGLRPTRPKYPVLASNPSGTVKVLPTSSLISAKAMGLLK